MTIDIVQVINITLGAFASFVLSLFIIIYIEKIKLPFLEFSIEIPAIELDYPSGRPATYHKGLRVFVKNRPLPCLLSWSLSRTAALNCRAIISFHHLDGQNVFGRSMNGRWVETPQPIPLVGRVGNQDLILIDEMRLTQISRIDIYAGDQTLLDIAGRFDQDQEAYGWSNDNYFSNPIWRAPQWRLPAGRYLVKVKIISSNTESTALFRIINDVSVTDFRLENAQPNDRAID